MHVLSSIVIYIWGEGRVGGWVGGVRVRVMVMVAVVVVAVVWLIG